jgi:glycosyltransferase involved in cell wall biosynthesis
VPGATPPDPGLPVELVLHDPSARGTGIGRYAWALHRHLSGRVNVRVTAQTAPPLARYLDFLRYLPTGVVGHDPGALVHFTEDAGCAQMLWRPVHPAVATSHDLGWLSWPPEARMHRAFDRALLRLSYLGLRRMDAVIAISEYSRRQLIEHLGIPEERVVTVHSGVDQAAFRPMEVDRAGLLRQHGVVDDPSFRYLLYVGSELPRKNLATILRALGRLPQSVRLLKLGGPGPRRFRRRTTELVARLGLADRVFLIGEVSDADLIRFYNAADAYVCASFLEGFGQPVLEAMACGLPVVSSSAGALPEIAGPAALLVAPLDDVGLAEAVDRLLGDAELRRRLIQHGLEQAARFSWDQTADGVLSVYRHVTGLPEAEPTKRQTSTASPGERS